MKKIAVIGSTGTIGKQTLAILKKHENEFKLSLLSANSNITKLLDQAAEFNPEFIHINNKEIYQNYRDKVSNYKLVNEIDFSQIPVDLVVIASSSSDSIKYVINAIKNNINIALANKESIVCCGELIIKLAKKHNISIIPIDSEHNAIFQCLTNYKKGYKNINTKFVKKIILTASGGPLFNYKGNFEDVTISQSIKHPNWIMGKKISLDSATMFNKALEIIEAFYLFNIEEIEYVIHRQSIVHSMVEFCDGSILAQMSKPDMKIPISFAIFYPDRINNENNQNLFNLNMLNLTFEMPNESNFPAPKLARYVLKQGGLLPCVFNCANEVVCEKFFLGKIKFNKIYDYVENKVMNFRNKKNYTLEDVYTLIKDFKEANQ